jgi:hypothetical protein
MDSVMPRTQPNRWLAAATCITIALAVGCDSAPHSQESAVAGSFEDLFTTVTRVRLEPPHGDPIGSVASVALWGDRFVIADAMQSNVKLFDRSGTWTQTVGRVGDGPGEFRTPLAAFPHTDGRLIVLDAMGRVAWFDSTGAFVAGWSTPPSLPHSLALDPDRGGIIISGRRTPDSPDEQSATPLSVHRYAVTGEPLESFAPLPPPLPGEGSFLGTMAAIVGSTVVSGQLSRNVLHYRDLDSGVEWSHRVASGVYRPHDWSLVAGTTFIEETTAFFNAGMWLMRIIALDCSRYAVGFRTIRDGEHLWQWVVRDLDGSELGATEPTTAFLGSTHASQIYATRMHGDGEVDVLVLELAVERTSPCTDPSPR